MKSFTGLEDARLWGMLPREITFLAAQAVAIAALLIVVLALFAAQEVPGLVWFAAGGPVLAITSAALFRLTFFLRRAAYVDYEKSASEG